MIEKSRVIILISGFLLIIVSIFLLTQAFIKSKHKDTSIYPGMNLESIMHNYDSVKEAIFYPSFKNEILDQPILDYIENERSLFEQNLPDEKQDDFEYYLFINFDVYDNLDGIYNLVFNQSTYFGGANPHNQVKTFSIDINNERYIDRDDIFKADFNRRLLKRYLSEAFNQSEYRNQVNKQALLEWVEDPEQSFSNVYFEDQEVIFLFSDYEVTSKDAGNPILRVPLEKLVGILNEAWVNRLINNYPHLGTILKKQPSKGSEKKIAITFDDGPHHKYTLELLDLLDQYNAQATFFLLGNRVKFYPDITREIAMRNHELGNHSYSHRSFTSLDFDGILDEINSTNELIKEATGQYPTLLRPPYGSFNDMVKEATRMPLVLWTIDSLDWRTNNPEAIANRVLQVADENHIILMHDIHAQSLEATKIILDELTKAGFTFVSVSDILY